MKKTTLIFLSLFFVALPATAMQEEKYEVPSVKDDYCGVVIQYQDCKCAFHNKNCSSATKKDSWESRIYVMNKFNSWVDSLIYKFATKCINQNGTWNKPTLTCTYLNKEEQINKKLDTRTIAEKYSLPELEFKPIPKESTVKGKVLSADGEVFVWSAAFRKWKGPVSNGALVYNGDVLITTSRGEAQLIIYGTGGQDIVGVRADTLLEIPDPTNFKKHDGTLWGILKGKAVEVYNAVTGNEVEVPMWRRQMQTVTVTLATRGTYYIVAYNEISNTSKIFLQEGEAEITPIVGGDTVVLYAGESYTYTGNGVVATSTMNTDEWNKIRAQYGFNKDKIYVSEKDLVRPNKLLTDTEISEINKADVLPDRNFFEEQVGTGKNFSWWIIIFIISIVMGVYYWKKQK